MSGVGFLRAGYCMAAALAMAFCGATQAQSGPTRNQLRADKLFATYAFAHEFGSGVYDFSGRTLQVYRLPFGWTARELADSSPGLRLRLPVTVGFVDFRPADVIETGLPDGVDSLSVVPGLQFVFAAGDDWRLLPYLQGGAAFASDSEIDTTILGAGMRAERDFDSGGNAGLYAVEAIYSGVRYSSDLPDDDFIRLRNSFELRRVLPQVTLFDRNLEVAPFTVVDAYLDPPTSPVNRLDVPRVQIESGIVLGTEPGWRPWGMPAPRVGLSYRYAGDLSSVRLVLGTPF